MLLVVAYALGVRWMLGNFFTPRLPLHYATPLCQTYRLQAPFGCLRATGFEISSNPKTGPIGPQETP